MAEIRLSSFYVTGLDVGANVRVVKQANRWIMRLSNHFRM